MSYVSLVLELDADGAERLSDALLEAGALSVSVEDPLAGTASEVPLYDEPDWKDDGQPAQWARFRLRVMIDGNGPVRAEDLLAQAARAAGLDEAPAHQVEHVPEEDWVRTTQAQFTPIPISRRLWIVPSWHQAPDPQAINIALDPGVAFGTGSHPTTKLCLRWLESRIQGGETVLDYGCGSGILAIVAARLGAGRVVGVDIEAGAVAAARDNAARNHVQADFRHAGEALIMQADVVVANILANPLKMLAPALGRHTRPGGSLALAGILVPQTDDVIAAYAPWFDMTAGEQEDGWICLFGTRK